MIEQGKAETAFTSIFYTTTTIIYESSKFRNSVSSLSLPYQCAISPSRIANKIYDCSLYRQEALLAAISEKDANIALLELSSSKKKKTQEEVAALKREKDSLVHQLKQQVGLLCTHTHTHIQTLTSK